jgi:hypothetical protein
MKLAVGDHLARMIRIGNDIGVEVDIVADPVRQTNARAVEIQHQRVGIYVGRSVRLGVI